LRSKRAEDDADGPMSRRFEALFRQHADAVLAYAVRRSDRDTAQEVVAETFAVAWRRLDAIPEPALPWLLGVARRVLANGRRSRARAEALALRIVSEPGAPSEDPADVVGARLSAQAAFGLLSSAEREVLELLAWEGLSPAQTAQVLGCSRAAIALRMHRARRHLGRLLDDPPKEPLSLIDRTTSLKEVDDAG
jgi:RNA polymerase sigma factor (sigma-70 family)